MPVTATPSYRTGRAYVKGPRGTGVARSLIVALWAGAGDGVVFWHWSRRAVFAWCEYEDWHGADRDLCWSAKAASKAGGLGAGSSERR